MVASDQTAANNKCNRESRRCRQSSGWRSCQLRCSHSVAAGRQAEPIARRARPVLFSFVEQLYISEQLWQQQQQLKLARRVQRFVGPSKLKPNVQSDYCAKSERLPARAVFGGRCGRGCRKCKQSAELSHRSSSESAPSDWRRKRAKRPHSNSPVRHSAGDKLNRCAVVCFHLKLCDD